MVNRRKRGSAGKLFTFTEELKRKTTVSIGAHLDTTLSPLEETRFLRKHTNLIKNLSNELHFTYQEIESLIIIYYKLLRDNNNRNRQEITKNEFRDILHYTFDITNPGITDYIMSRLDKLPGPNFNMENWLRSLSLFLRGSFEEKMKYCFDVYDITSKGALNPKIITQLMSGALIGEEDQEAVKDLVEEVVKKMDRNRSGEITFSDFKHAVTAQPLLMECFGQCLPTRLGAKAFTISFTPYIGKL